MMNLIVMVLQEPGLAFLWQQSGRLESPSLLTDNLTQLMLEGESPGHQTSKVKLFLPGSVRLSNLIMRDRCTGDDFLKKGTFESLCCSHNCVNRTSFTRAMIRVISFPHMACSESSLIPLVHLLMRGATTGSWGLNPTPGSHQLALHDLVALSCQRQP